ncbi:hypothetical protein Y1Q_0017023 [Alligator mississippiensis]|uniref:Uncharacterized protein n=1 Tax=Alligator mississippiensis TaxID=8496 RepID=A0A151MLN0_ALLMI|nr:hypothetical protein Y1Q_0017023 [Alligator mississippiensis]
MFCMSRDTFHHIVLMLAPKIVWQDTIMYLSIALDKKVATAIMKLATPNSLHYIGNQFSMAPCMAGVAVCEPFHRIKFLLGLGRFEQVFDLPQPS